MPISPSAAGTVTISTSSEYVRASGVTISSFRVFAMLSSGFLDFFDAAFHIEVAFRHFVMLAIEDFLEPTHGVSNGNLFARPAGEYFGNTERLAQEPLDFAGAEHGQFVVR